jgi:hypothetical protein
MRFDAVAEPRTTSLGDVISVSCSIWLRWIVASQRELTLWLGRNDCGLHPGWPSATRRSEEGHRPRLNLSNVSIISGWPLTSASGCGFVAIDSQSKDSRWRIAIVSASSKSRGRNAKSLRTIRSSAEQVRKEHLASNSNKLDRSTRSSSNGRAAKAMSIGTPSGD